MDGSSWLEKREEEREGSVGRGFSGVVEGQRLGAQAKWYVPRARDSEKHGQRRAEGVGRKGGAAAEVLLRRDGESGELQQLLAGPGRGTLLVRCVTLEKVGTSGSAGNPGSHAAALSVGTRSTGQAGPLGEEGSCGDAAESLGRRTGSLTARWSGPCLWQPG